MGPHVPILEGKVEIRVTGLRHVDTVLCRQRERQRSREVTLTRAMPQEARQSRDHLGILIVPPDGLFITIVTST